MATTGCCHKSNSGVSYWLIETAELLPTSLCSFVISEHVYHHVERRVANGQTMFCPPFIHFDLNLSPGLVLASCLIFGVSVSSFVYRRRDKNPAQAVIFSLVITVAIVLGYGAGASASLILLGWLPWAADVAMVISVWNHYVSSGGDKERRGVDEKLGISE